MWLLSFSTIFVALDYLPQSWRGNRLFAILDICTPAFFPLLLPPPLFSSLARPTSPSADRYCLCPCHSFIARANAAVAEVCNSNVRVGSPEKEAHPPLLFFACPGRRLGLDGHHCWATTGLGDEDGVATLAKERCVSPLSLSSSTEATLPPPPSSCRGLTGPTG